MRTILIVHESASSRMLLRKFIMSEFSDAMVTEVPTLEDCTNVISSEKFDVILCGKQIIENGSENLLNFLKLNQFNIDTPVVVLTADSSLDKVMDLKQQGINYILKTPFTPLELRAVVSEALNPRGRREDSRISMPGTKVRVLLDDYELEGDVINISKSGILCDFIGKRIDPEILNSTDISVMFPNDFNGVSLKNITCKFLRLQVLNWDNAMYPDCIPNHIRVVWQIINMSFEDNKTLNELLEKASKDIYEMH